MPPGIKSSASTAGRTNTSANSLLDVATYAAELLHAVTDLDTVYLAESDWAPALLD